MHGYRHHEHELAVAEIAREIEFTQVSVSHEVSPLMKLVGRGDTAVVDAYLSPILRAYVDRVAGEAGDVRLMFMQSNGGLVDARLFQGKDAILSGPAGGVVGAAKTAALAGFDRIVGFDMGGTSTDVTHYAGAFERAFDTEVAGVRIRAPMMKIHTVAAGGSIISFDGQRFRIGPEKRRRQRVRLLPPRRPLAVTDANLMVGKLLPEFFPRVFGPGADQPLDAEVVRAAFAALAQEVHKATGIERSPEELAQGCLAIANDNMANAIKEISIQRGIDVTKGYTLCCFHGSAGAQHACHVADLLGIARVHIHPLASVLSAYRHGPRRHPGLAPAHGRAAPRRGGRRGARDGRGGAAGGDHRRAAGAGRTRGADRHRDPRPRPLRRDGHLAGGAAGEADELRAAFEAEHRSRYGFVVEGRGLVVEAVTVEGIGATEEIRVGSAGVAAGRRSSRSCGRRSTAAPRTSRPSAWSRSPAREKALRPGDSVSGPALICGATTVVVEPGWALEVTGRDDLVLHRVEPLARQAAVGTRCDPILLEIFNNLFMRSPSRWASRCRAPPTR